jgi:signal transduction histidine kinase
MKSFQKSCPSLSKRRGFLIASLTLVPAQAKAAGASLAETCASLSINALPIVAALAGTAVACGVLAVLFRGRTRELERQSLRQLARLEMLSTIETHFRALAALEAQALVIWTEGRPLLAMHTLPIAHGVPAKLPQLLRFGSWLHPDDVEGMAESLEGLQIRGAAFSRNASTLEGQVVEIAGGISGADTVLRIRPFSPVNKELIRLIGENKRLKQLLGEREKLLDALPVPVWIRDAKGALSWVNNAYVNAVGSERSDEAIHKQIELFETRQRSELLRIARSKTSGRVKLQTVVNGCVQLYEAIAVQFERGSGGAAFDVAPLATAQDELDRQIAAHSRTLDKVSTGVAVFGADKRLVYGNDAFARIWGLENSWLEQRPTGTEFLDFLRQKRLLPEQSNYRSWREDRVLSWEKNRTLDEFWHRPDGRTVHVVTDCRDDGSVTFHFDDVTEKLALERQYHSLIESQRETLDHLNEGIAVFGSDGRLQLFNPAFKALWKMEDSALQHSPHLEDFIKAGEHLASDSNFWQTLRSAVTGMPDARDTIGGTIETNGSMHLAYAATPLPDGGTLLAFADVTDSKRFEEVLLERNEALEASDRLKTTFLSHVSYELRTPLTTIIGFADLLAEPSTGPLNSKQRDYLNDIKTSSHVLLNIINDILDLAVIDAGALDLRLAPVEIRQVIEAAELGVRERLSRAKVNLEVHVAPGAGTVMADENRLIQVLYNLLSNAIGFSPEDGTITLTCRRERKGVTISVQDTGLGIPEEEQATVFERFESRSKGSRHRGAGLGLSLVKSIVELHKGGVDLRSSTGAGTTVTIFLPDNHPALQQMAKTDPAIPHNT